MSSILFLGKIPPEATFKGQDYLSYDLIRLGGEPIVSTKDSISLDFKTNRPDGLLFYTGFFIVKKLYCFLSKLLFNTFSDIFFRVRFVCFRWRRGRLLKLSPKRWSNITVNQPWKWNFRHRYWTDIERRKEHREIWWWPVASCFHKKSCQRGKLDKIEQYNLRILSFLRKICIDFYNNIWIYEYMNNVNFTNDKKFRLHS